MITGDAKYGDWVENAVFNAGLGSIDDDFKGHQYFSCPNQVIADDFSNHSKFYRGNECSSFAPAKFLACCTGNVNRIMPNFVARAWMRDKDNLYPFVYTPSEINVEINGIMVRVEEITNYPFDELVRFVIHVEREVEFSLVLRQPEWATGTVVKFNSEECDARFVLRKFAVRRVFKDGDEITVKFTSMIRFIENAKGVSVKKGALLYALPVKEKMEIKGLRSRGNTDFPHYSLYADSKWNYGLDLEDLNYSFINGKIGAEPWRKSDSGLGIEISAREVIDWKIKKVKGFQRRLLPRAKCVWVKQEATFTPKVKVVKDEKVVGEKEKIVLVPYCTTRLRIAIFPKILKTKN